MRLLVVDTATSVCSFAVADDGHLLAAEECAGGVATAARLVPAFERIMAAAGLKPSGLDGLAVTVGPGSFTGLRVGMAFVKGLAYGLKIPVVPLSSLELLAMNLAGSRLPVCPMFDARKNEVYCGLFDLADGKAKVLLPPMAVAPPGFLAKLAGEIIFLGDGALRYRELIVDLLGVRAVFAPDHQHQPAAAAGIPLAMAGFSTGRAVDPCLLIPEYLRLSEAEIKRA